jgi:arginine deiminase
MTNGNNNGFNNPPSLTEIGLRLNNLAQHELISAQQQSINLAKQADRNNQTLAQKLNEANSEIDYLRALLCKPMAEIAAVHQTFNQTYQKQQELIADWMVSQKAFKELAIEYGFQLGKTKDEVVKEGMDKKEDVLNDKHNPDHNTNANQSTTIPPHKESLLKKIKK